MELSFAKCESIISTLPIGFYTGRRIPVTLEKEAETSFYSPMEDKIIVSYPIIQHRCQQITGNCNEEEAVRSMLYHEVSHAILTPTDHQLDTSFRVNAMEDERIETVLRHYYHGVDFRQQLYDVHGGHAPQAVDLKSAYFNAVRFGLGTAKVQKRVKKILKNYAGLNRNSQRYHGDPNCCSYESDIDALWELIADEFDKSPEEFQPQDGEGGEGEPQEIDKCESSDHGQGQEQQGESQKKQPIDSQEKQPSDNPEEQNKEGKPAKGDPHECELSEEQIKRMIGNALDAKKNLSKSQIQKLNDFQKTVEMIIGNFNKKNKGGSGINAYSGVFNPRAVTRPDYRFFDRAMSTQGNNKFGTCHLNLIIDCSGSFSDNEDLTNGILMVLSEVERKNKNFSMDVGFINNHFRLCENVRDRVLETYGGNSIPENMKEILMKMQKPQTCNYNIVLFDGDAVCGCAYGEDANRRFSAFDMKQTTLITDPDNEKYMEPPFTATKVVVTQDYTEELIDHIIHALTIAFG